MKAQLRRSIAGYIIVPLDPEADGVVAKLYNPNAERFDDIPQQEKFFERELSMDQALTHVLEVCRGLGIKVSVCGNRKMSPTLRFFPPNPPAPIITFDVDLKWSLWSADLETWDDRGYRNVVDAMRKAFDGTGPSVKVRTGPKKEIRYGSVTISKHRAEGVFSTEWDDISSLADTLGVVIEDEDAKQAFADSIPFSSKTLEPGLDQDFVIKTRSFNRMLRLVDEQEGELIARDASEWRCVESLHTNQLRL